jgi:hypothetical protein
MKHQWEISRCEHDFFSYWWTCTRCGFRTERREKYGEPPVGIMGVMSRIPYRLLENCDEMIAIDIINS